MVRSARLSPRVYSPQASFSLFVLASMRQGSLSNYSRVNRSTPSMVMIGPPAPLTRAAMVLSILG